MNVTRAALPVMRKQRSGLVVAISSTAGIAGQMFCTAYAAAKFGIEGWMMCSRQNRRLRNPHDAGRARVLPYQLLSNDSTTYAQPSVDGYAERTKEIVAAWKSIDGKQGGDPRARQGPRDARRATRNRRPVLLPAQMQCRRSRPRPTRCSHRPKPTANCPLRSHTTTPDRELIWR